MISDITAIKVIFSDGGCGAGCGICAVNQAVVVLPLVRDAGHIIGGHSDIQINSLIQRGIDVFAVFPFILAFGEHCQMVFDFDSIIHSTVVAVFILAITIIRTAFLRFKCIRAGIRTFNRIIVGIIPLVADF